MLMRRIALISFIAVFFGSCTRQEAPPEQPVPPAYDSIEYLSDHLALGLAGGTAFLLTPDGTVVATADDAEALRTNAEAAWAHFLDEEYTCWESILDQYDNLCNACAARRPADELLSQLESIRAQLKAAVGQMDPQQKARFAAIRERYGKYRR